MTAAIQRLSLRVALCTLVLVGPANTQQTDEQVTDLLQPNSLAGWRHVSEDPATKLEDVWSIKNGVLSCTGVPSGYLITTREDFRDYQLSLEWRWHTNRGGNNGVLLHCSTPGVLGIWCKSVEVQLAHQDAGDFWVIGTDLDVPDEEQRRSDRRYRNLVDGVERPLGDWNQMEITCQGKTITVYVNGVLVNQATNVSEQQGAIALQSEGTPIQFRRIQLRSLP